MGRETNNGSKERRESELQTLQGSLTDSNARRLKPADPPGRPDKAFCPEPWTAGVCLRGKQMVTNSGWCFRIQLWGFTQSRSNTQCWKNVEIHVVITRPSLMFHADHTDPSGPLLRRCFTPSEKTLFSLLDALFYYELAELALLLRLISLLKITQSRDVLMV